MQARLGWLMISGAVMVAGLPLSAVLSADAPTGGDKRTRAYVMTNIFVASSGAAGTCPVMSKELAEIFIKSLPPAEQALYAAPDKKRDLILLMWERFGFQRLSLAGKRGKTLAKLPPGFDPAAPMTSERLRQLADYNGFPKGKGTSTWHDTEINYDSCSNPEDFPQLAKGYVDYAGEVAPGLDLDGKTGSKSFAGLNGEKGVDNQLWRALGCQKAFREEGDHDTAKENIYSAEAPTGVVIRDLDDVRNDPDVTVDVYSVRETLVRDARGKVLAGATYTPVSSAGNLHATVRGRIVDGVLLTDPVDFDVRFREQIVDTIYEFRNARIRMAFKPDGSVEGSINSYITLASFHRYMQARTQQSSDFVGYSCPAVYQSVNRLADGLRDPVTKRFTAISSSYGFFGVRAFVEPPRRQSAGNGGQQ